MPSGRAVGPLEVRLPPEAAPRLRIPREQRVLPHEVQAIATRRRDREEPEEHIVAQHRLQVPEEGAVIRGGGIANPLHGLLAELDRGHGLERKPQVEGEKDSHQGAQEACKRLSEQQQEHRREGRATVDGLLHRSYHGPSNEVAVDRCVEEEQEEILVVPESHAVVDPRTMMVHLQDAHSADAAMVATVWLVLCAPLAVAPVARALRLLQAGHPELQRGTAVLGNVLPACVLLLVRDGARVHEDTQCVADDEEARDDVEDGDQRHPVQMPLAVPQQGDAVEDGVDGVQAGDDGDHEYHRQELCLLCKAPFP
mmetsp:Transcript_53537/g.120693  ORF Transcript_53537/g.120693 Transcript_53537/m.120693 type:complete len:311 (+) Transcript_53537:262-1194(+)